MLIKIKFHQYWKCALHLLTLYCTSNTQNKNVCVSVPLSNSPFCLSVIRSQGLSLLQTQYIGHAGLKLMITLVFQSPKY